MKNWKSRAGGASCRYPPENNFGRRESWIFFFPMPGFGGGSWRQSPRRCCQNVGLRTRNWRRQRKETKRMREREQLLLVAPVSSSTTPPPAPLFSRFNLKSLWRTGYFCGGGGGARCSTLEAGEEDYRSPSKLGGGSLYSQSTRTATVPFPYQRLASRTQRALMV